MFSRTAFTEILALPLSAELLNTQHTLGLRPTQATKAPSQLLPIQALISTADAVVARARRSPEKCILMVFVAVLLSWKCWVGDVGE